LFRVVLFEAGDEGARLLVLAHRLVVDETSWGLLLDQLGRAYEQLLGGKKVDLGGARELGQAWVLRLEEQARLAERDLPRWSEILAGLEPLPKDEEGANTVERERFVEVALGAKETDALLTKVPNAYRTQLHDVVLTALAGAIEEWTGRTG